MRVVHGRLRGEGPTSVPGALGAGFLLGQATVRELDERASDHSRPTIEEAAPAAARRDRRSRRPVGKRLMVVVFLAFGVFTVVGLGWSTIAAIGDGRPFTASDVAQLSIMVLATAGVLGQAISVVKVLPGGRWLWSRGVGLSRKLDTRAAAPRPARPLLGQVSTAELSAHRSGETDQRRVGAATRRAARVAASGTWIALTLLLIALAGLVALAVVAEAGWNIVGSPRAGAAWVGALLAVVVGFGVASMSVRLVRSWFQMRLRRRRRLLSRLSRYLLRLFGARPAPASSGLAGRLVIAATGCVLVTGLAVVPVFAESGGSATNLEHVAAVARGLALSDSGRTGDSPDAGGNTGEGGSVDQEMQGKSVSRISSPFASSTTATGGGDSRQGTTTLPTPTPGEAIAVPLSTTTTTAGGVTATSVVGVPDPSVTSTTSRQLRATTTTTSPWRIWPTTTTSTSLPPQAMTSTTAPWRATTTTTTTPRATTTTTAPRRTTTSTTSPPRSTTTTTTSPPRTTTTTTTTPADTSGPSVSGVSDSPDPIYTSGSPTTTAVRATVTDPSGVASVTLYYRTGKGGFAGWGSLKEGAAGSYVVGFGPFSVAGIYEYRIVAVAGLGNANCATSNLSGCPGGTTTVIASR